MREVFLIKEKCMIVLGFFRCRTCGFSKRSKRNGVCIFEVFASVCFSLVPGRFGRSPSGGILDDFLTQFRISEKLFWLKLSCLMVVSFVSL